jgi:pimeloyl-ACP methyl ester carboxylesterase
MRNDPDLGRVSEGTFSVPENRAAPERRTLHLRVLVLHAAAAAPRADPVVYLAGGPGQDATTTARQWAEDWMRQDRDIVLVSQRGTGGSMRLDCRGPARGGEAPEPPPEPPQEPPQAWLDPIFDEPTFRECLAALSARADLTQYSTENAADDLNEARAALGYDTVNLYGGSYGTRAALAFMRRYPRTVRCAILEGVAPIAFTNPLYHAREAQVALDAILAECAADPGCSAAFPDLAHRFKSLMARLDHEPVRAWIDHPGTGERTEVALTRDAFAEALRVLMYYLPASRQVPRLLDRACAGEFEPFAAAAVASNRGIRDTVAFGMLFCVTCAEDVARIDEAAIIRETAGTFLGDARVRAQQRICRFWPRSPLPPDWAEPVRADVPTLLISGTIDPVTSPRWGGEAARHLPRSRHIIAPGAHGVDDPCIESIKRAFLETADVRAIDDACISRMRLPPLVVGGN